MRYNYKYRLSPDPAVEQDLERHIDICRQAYNHFLYELTHAEERLSRYQLQSMLPGMKEWWDHLSDVYSKVPQMVVKRVSDNLSRLREKKERGYKVGRLRWKGPHQYRSLTYNQVGFKLKNTSGQPVLFLSKIGVIPIRLHRLSLTTPRSNRSPSSRKRPVSGSLPSAWKWTENPLRNRITPRTSSVSTWAS